MKYNYSTGRRKTSVARVYMSEGTGKVTVNNKDISEYFGREYYRQIALSPFASVDAVDQYDVKIVTKGGGLTGQAGAIKLGIARALLTFDEERRPILRKEKHLTRDSREVERKKYGKKGARASFQFSKR